MSKPLLSRFVVRPWFYEGEGHDDEPGPEETLRAADDASAVAAYEAIHGEMNPAVTRWSIRKAGPEGKS